MAADVWFKRDIANALLAVNQSMRETLAVAGGEDKARVATYRSGYRSAISTLALFFGISPSMVLTEESLDDTNLIEG